MADWEAETKRIRLLLDSARRGLQEMADCTTYAVRHRMMMNYLRWTDPETKDHSEVEEEDESSG